MLMSERLLTLLTPHLKVLFPFHIHQNSQALRWRKGIRYGIPSVGFTFGTCARME